jgi:hypothetical protein
MNVQILDRSAPAVVERDVVARPTTHKPRLSRKQLGLATFRRKIPGRFKLKTGLEIGKTAQTDKYRLS